MATTVGSLNIILSASAAGVMAGLSRASAMVSGFASSITSAFGGFGGAAGALGLGAVGIGAVKLASDLEQAGIAFEVMFGSAEKGQKVLKDIQKFAAETPFQSPELIAGARQLAAYGFAAEDLVPTLRAVGDIASGTGQPIGELTYLVGTLRTQGRAFAKDIREFSGRGVPLIAELAKQFGVTEAEVAKLVENGKVGFPEVAQALNSMVGPGGRFENLTGRMSQTVGGLFSTVLDNAKLALTDVGGGIIRGLGLHDLLKEGITFTEGFKQQVAGIEQFFRGVRDVAGVAFQVIGDGFTALVQFTQPAIDKVREWGGGFTSARETAVEAMRFIGYGVQGAIEVVKLFAGAVDKYLVAPFLKGLQVIIEAAEAAANYIPGLLGLEIMGTGHVKEFAAALGAASDKAAAVGQNLLDNSSLAAARARVDAVFDKLKANAQEVGVEAAAGAAAAVGQIAGAGAGAAKEVAKATGKFAGLALQGSAEAVKAASQARFGGTAGQDKVVNAVNKSGDRVVNAIRDVGEKLASGETLLPLSAAG